MGHRAVAICHGPCPIRMNLTLAADAFVRRSPANGRGRMRPRHHSLLAFAYA